MLGHSVFDPLSPQAHAISNLFIFASVIAVAIIALISAVLAYTTIRFRDRPGQGDPPQTFGLRWLEITWTATAVGPAFCVR
jgi:heme/copper-type cytochrome/quinol oxidase subunit 2